MSDKPEVKEGVGPKPEVKVDTESGKAVEDILIRLQQESSRAYSNHNFKTCPTCTKLRREVIKEVEKYTTSRVAEAVRVEREKMVKKTSDKILEIDKKYVDVSKARFIVELLDAIDFLKGGCK